MAKQKYKKGYSTPDKMGFPRAVTAAWVYLMFTLFPLIYHDYYFDILETKTKTFYFLTVTMIVLAAGWGIFSGEFAKVFGSDEKFGFSLTDWSMLAFWGVAGISTLAAGKYMKQAFTGEEGRFVGFAFITTIMLAYFLVTRYLNFSKHMVTAFLCMEILLCLFGITDFYCMNLLHFKDHMKNGQEKIFFSTIGNINSYTVMVTEGNFIVDDSVTLFRDSAYTEKLRIGRGNIARVNPTAVTGTGAVVSVAVKDGDAVKRGDLLMETLSGTFEGYEMTGTSVKAEEEGVIVSVAAEAGAAVNKGDIVIQMAPVSGMRVEAAVTADDRQALKAGDKVLVELEADGSISYEGTVRYIAEMPEEGTEEVTYKAVIDFTPDGNVYFGMPVVVTTPEAAE